MHRCLHGIMALIEDHAERAGIPPRFAASKLAEGDRLVLERLDLDQNEKDALEHIISQMEAERGLDRSAADSPTCGSASSGGCGERTVVKPGERVASMRAARPSTTALTGPFTAIPAFVANSWRWCSWLTFNVVGAWPVRAAGRGHLRLTDVVASGACGGAR